MPFYRVIPYVFTMVFLPGCFVADALPDREDLLALADDVTEELNDLDGREAQQVFCRYSQVLQGRISVRSGIGADPDPVLCYDSGAFDWTALLGGLGLALCWDEPEQSVKDGLDGYNDAYNEDDGNDGNGVGAGWEGFQDSNCAAEALGYWGFSASSFDSGSSELATLLTDYSSGDFEDSENRDTAEQLICALPGALSSIVASVQDVICP